MTKSVKNDLTNKKLNYQQFKDMCNNTSMEPLSEENVKLKILDYLFSLKNKKGVQIWHPDTAEITFNKIGGGVDIYLRGGNDNGRRILIEGKGKSYAEKESSRNSADKETSWLSALGQIITRIDVDRVIKTGKSKGGRSGAYTYGLGLYWVSAQHALPRIPKKIALFLNLRIFSVHDNGHVRYFTAKDFGKEKEKYTEDVFMSDVKIKK